MATDDSRATEIICHLLKIKCTFDAKSTSLPNSPRINGELKESELATSTKMNDKPAICNVYAPDDLIYTHCQSWSVSHAYNMTQHVRNHELESKIVHQVGYYFCKDNLVKDPFLRMQMNEFGWVPIQLIAGFNLMIKLTKNIFVILDALRLSTVVEVQGYKVRRRGDWKQWLWPPEFKNVQLIS